MSHTFKIKDRQVFIKKEPLEVPQFRCIININTNIYEEKQRCRRHRTSKTRQSMKSRLSDTKNKKSEVRKKRNICQNEKKNKKPVVKITDDKIRWRELKNKKLAAKKEDRIVPLCFRDRSCNGGRSSFLNMSDNTLSKRPKTKSDRYCSKCRRHHKKDKLEKQGKKDKTVEDYLSPISSLELSDSEISLENISSDTADSDFEIDKLIQRTKKLEKHTDIFQLKPETFAQCSPDTFMTSTPCENQNVMHNSETDVGSIHSVATVKLETTSLKNRSWHSNETLNILSIYDQDETLDFMNETENIEIKQELNYSPSNEQFTSMPILYKMPEINVKVEENENLNNFCDVKQETYAPCTEW